MTDRLTSNLHVLRALIEQAPDNAVRDLESALGGDMAGEALAGVRAMIDAEVADRRARDTVLAPLKPMFGPRADGVDQLTFPRGALGGLWRAARLAFPAQTEAAAVLAMRRAEEGVFPQVYDDLCLLCAEAIRTRVGESFAALSAQLNAAAPGGAEQLAACLELSGVARRALARLPEWLSRITEERAATIRLAYKDAVAIAPDGGPRLFEILFANLAEPWTILRLISAVMVRPVDNYVSASELAVFGERILADIEGRLGAVRAFDLELGHAGGEAMGADIRIIGAEIDEFEQALNLGREGPWGARLTRVKAALAKAVEGHLRKADDVVAAALPMAPYRIGGRIIRQAPRLDAAPDERLLRRATAMLTLIDRVRGAAVNGGYNSLRLKAVEEIENRLGAYVEDLLDTIHRGEGEEIAVARLYLDVAADMTGRIRDDKAAQIVRRRAAVA